MFNFFTFKNLLKGVKIFLKFKLNKFKSETRIY